MNIIVFSRPIHSGKTTELINWCNGRTDVQGILMPDVNGKRKFLDVKTNETFAAEDDNHSAREQIITIGRFTFLQASFDKANGIIRNAANDGPNWLIIDECGKLELQKQGLYNSILHVMNSTSAIGNLILVVRTELMHNVISFFDIQIFRVVSSLSEI